MYVLRLFPFFYHSIIPAGCVGDAGRRATAQKHLREVICDQVSDGSYQVPVKQVPDSEHQAEAEEYVAEIQQRNLGYKLSFELIRVKF